MIENTNTIPSSDSRDAIISPLTEHPQPIQKEALAGTTISCALCDADTTFDVFYWKPEDDPTIEPDPAISFVPDPVNPSRNCLQLTVHENDRAQLGGNGQKTERTELDQRRELLPRSNDLVTYSLNFYLPTTGFPNEDVRCVLAQIKQSFADRGNPPVSIRIRNGVISVKLISNMSFGYEEHEDLALDGKNDKKVFSYQPPVGTLYDAWHRLQIAVRFNTTDGICKVCIDDAEICDHTGTVGYVDPDAKGDSRNKFKFGIYRDTHPKPMKVLYKDFSTQTLP